MQHLWQYYLLIILVIIQGIFLCKEKKPAKSIFVILCSFELIFIAGFRSWHIGNDTISYVGIFEAIINHIDIIKSHMESGFLLFNQVLALFTSNPQMLLLITSIFIIGTWLYSFYKYSDFILLSVILFTITGFSLTLTMIRQEMAMCIILLSLPFIIKRHLMAFIICWAIATSFHTSAFATIFLYFLYPLELKFTPLMLVAISTVVLFVYLGPILDTIIAWTGRYAVYKTNNGLSGEELKIANIMNTLVQFAITAGCLFSYKCFYRNPSHPEPILRVSFLLWCRILSFCLQCISTRAILLERLVLYFSMFNFISLPFFVRCYPKKIRVLVAAGLIVCFALYQSIVFVYRPDWNHVLPFEFCF